MKPRTRWSFSQWSTYQKCPAQYNYRYVQRLPYQTSTAATRGTDTHAAVENYVKCELHDYPLPNDYLKATLDAYRNHPNGERWTEKKMAFDKDWNSVWVGSPESSCVMVLDAMRCGDDWRKVKVEHWKGNQEHVYPESRDIVYVAEWKTGKPWDEHKEQRLLYALGALRWMHYSTEVQVTTYYLDNTSEPQRTIVKRTAEEKLKALWNERATVMLNDDILAPRPGFYCRWCSYSKDKGGPCRVG